MSNNKCKLCKRTIEKKIEYCVYHEKALKNLKSSYDNWKKALNISWEDYLIKISEQETTGNWVKEVAKNMLKKSN